MQSAQFKASREFLVFFFFPILVSNGQFYFRLIRLGPAEDCLLLVSSRPDGHCCVETANLDGETNLKKKAAAMTSEEFHAARFQWSDELNVISTYFNILGLVVWFLLFLLFLLSIHHPSIIGFYQTPSLLVLQDAAWNCRRIGPGCSPSLLCEAPNGDLYSFKSSLCNLEKLERQKH